MIGLSSMKFLNLTAYQDEDIICRCAGQILIADKCSVAKTGCDDNMSVVAKSAAISLSVKYIFSAIQLIR